MGLSGQIVTNPDGTKRVVAWKWSDDLYVTLTSSVGPNPADIIAWLLEKYTSLSVDTDSFDHVRTRLANYPCQFALLERMNVMQLISLGEAMILPASQTEYGVLLRRISKPAVVVEARKPRVWTR